MGKYNLFWTENKMLIVDLKNGGHMEKYLYQLNAYFELVKENNTDVKFIKDGHIYKNRDGVEVPSFSEIADYVKKIYRDDTVIEGMKRGSYIHCACELLTQGETIKPDTLKGDSEEPVNAWKKFLNDFEILSYIRITEQPYISKLGYTGTPDLIIPDYPGKNELWLIYLKTDGTYKKVKVAIDKAKFHEFRCWIVTYNSSKKL